MGICDLSLASRFLAAQVVSLHDPQDLHFRRGVDKQDQVKAVLHPHFEKQRDIGQDDRLPVLPPDLVPLALRLLENGRMDDAFEYLAPLLIVKDEGAQLLPVDPVFGVQNVTPEGLNDPLPDGPSRLLQGVDEAVVIDHPGTSSRRASGPPSICRSRFPLSAPRSASARFYHKAPVPSTQNPRGWPARMSGTRNRDKKKREVGIRKPESHRKAVLAGLLQ